MNYVTNIKKIMNELYNIKPIYYLSDSMISYLKDNNIEIIELYGREVVYNFVINFDDNWYYLLKREHKDKRYKYYYLL